MQSMLASTSKRLLQSTLPSSLRSTRFVSTQTRSTSTTETTSSSSSPPSVTPLPGSSVLPAAFQSPSSSASPSRTRDSLPLTNPPSSPLRRSSVIRPQPYKLSILSTRNNTILTLSTSPLGGDASPQDPHVPIAWVSAGSAGYKGASRGTYDAAVEVSLKMFTKIRELLNGPEVLAGGVKRKSKGPKPTELEVVWKGFGQGRDAVFRSLMGAEGDEVRGLVRRVTDATPLKIGGTRAKKRRVI